MPGNEASGRSTNIRRGIVSGIDSLPCVLPKNHADLIVPRLRLEAQEKFAINQLPANLDEWKVYREELKTEIMKKTGVVINHRLALNMKETGTVKGSSGYVILCNPEGKDKVDPALIEKLKKDGAGIVIVDLSGTGESTSSLSASYDISTRLHTLSRAELWLGETVLGEWVKELTVVVLFLSSNFKAQKICIDAYKEAALAGLFYGAAGGNVDHIILREAPVSYLFDNPDSVNFFSMGIHLPGILNWGDISLVAALCGKNIQFIKPVSMSGNLINGDQLNAVESEFEKIRSLCHQSGITTFNQ